MVLPAENRSAGRGLCQRPFGVKTQHVAFIGDAGLYFGTGQPALAGKGKFQFVAIMTGGLIADDGQYFALVQMADAPEGIVHRLLFSMSWRS